MNPRGGFLRRSAIRTFRDRHEAGRALAEELTSYRDKDNLIVLGLARGGVPVAAEIAAALRAPLDVFLVRKLGVPRWSELAMGALASGGGVVMNDDVVAHLHITDEQVREVIDSETAELTRRERAYRGGRPAADLTGKIVILVDDGIATGASVRAALTALRQRRPRALILAVPVAPADTIAALRPEVDEVICLRMPEPFMAIGLHYRDFHQLSDADVVRTLARARATPPAGRAGSTAA
jgi:predicted phosphoribosyltransferase